MQAIAQALRRVESIVRRRPAAALHEDTAAHAIWQGDLRVVTGHAGGVRLATDMPPELGGAGAQVTPGWLMRAALAACAATRIAMSAAAEAIELTSLEVVASSRSDVRGLLGIGDEADAPVVAGPRDLQLRVRIAAAGVAPERLRALVEHAHRHSPVGCAIENAQPVALAIEIG